MKYRSHSQFVIFNVILLFLTWKSRTLLSEIVVWHSGKSQNKCSEDKTSEFDQEQLGVGCEAHVVLATFRGGPLVEKGCIPSRIPPNHKEISLLKGVYYPSPFMGRSLFYYRPRKMR